VGMKPIAKLASILFLSTLLLACAAEGDADDEAYAPDLLVDDSELVGNGYTIFSWGTTHDDVGIDIGSKSNRTCFLAGVAGNLNVGAQPNFNGGVLSRESLARVSDKYPSTGHYWLVARGGAFVNQVNEQVWQNNPVNGQATCIFTTNDVKQGSWQSGDYPKKVAEISTGSSDVRQCFLSGLWGISGSWNTSASYARVTKHTTTDATHPTTGWYIDAHLPKAADGSHARVEARCVDFPYGTVLSTGALGTSGGGSYTSTLTSGAGIKACGLTGLAGAMNVNSWSDGALMNFPSQIDGQWSMTVKNGKTARWACAR
jgi:hypothetical protein